MPRLVKGPDGTLHSFPDAATDAQISEALSAEPAHKARTWTDSAVDLLPAAGGAVGSLVGGTGGTVLGMGVGGVPGAVGGAALGGALGESAKQLINRARGADAPASPGAAAAQIGTQGAEQGAIQGAGSGLGVMADKLSAALANRVMESALKPAAKYTLAAIKAGEDIPVVKTLLDEGVNVTKGGIQKLNALMKSNPGEDYAALKLARNATAERLATLVGEDPETVLKYALSKSQAVKSMLARGLYTSAGNATGIAPQVIRAAVAGVVSQEDSQ